MRCQRPVQGDLGDLSDLGDLGDLGDLDDDGRSTGAAKSTLCPCYFLKQRYPGFQPRPSVLLS